MELYIIFALSVGVGVFAWHIRGRKPQTTVKVRRGDVSVKGPVSSHQLQEMRQFFREEFSDTKSLKVLIYPLTPSPRPRIVVRGDVEQSEAQMIRNFLNSVLS